MNFIVLFVLCTACAVGGGVYESYFVKLTPTFLPTSFDPTGPTGASYALITLV
jgi:hypothetical protein